MSNPSRKPYLTEAVHYQSRGSLDKDYLPVCRAAIVTEVFDGALASIAVLTPQGMFFHAAMPHDEHRSPGSFHWAH